VGLLDSHRNWTKPRGAGQADIVGFLVEDDSVSLAFGEVKTSFDSATPPGVMHGRSGMIYQLENLADNLAIHQKLLKWLHARCKHTQFWPLYERAVSRYLSSDGQDFVLFGMLMRDTSPERLDLKARAEYLAIRLAAPTRVELTAWYLPRPIQCWPLIVAEGT
jgi:hypothetical protein